MTGRRVLHIANVSGFYGDRLRAPAEMLAGSHPVDVLTGDYLAELTMLILWKARRKDPSGGYARTFLTQMEQVLGTCLDRGVRVVVNAGGLNPRGLAAALGDLAERLGVHPAVAVVEGDDLIDRLEELQGAGHDLRHLDTGRALPGTPVTANAYLGAWGIAAGLANAADVVVCGRVTDASLVVGPAAWWHGWGRDDWDRLASAVVAGHVLECGPQATGGNYPFVDELRDGYPGFPIAEMEADGSFVVTKHPGTGGAVNVGTVTAQLLYELGEPAYGNPDVVARFDTIRLEQTGEDRVRVSGVRGEPSPGTLKVGLNFDGGYRNTMTMVLTGLDAERKAARAEALLWEVLGGKEQFADVDVQLLRLDREGAASNVEAMSHLRVTVKDPDAAKVGRRFSNAVVELALAGYAGFFTTTPPMDASAFGVYWPAMLPADAVEHRVLLADGSVVSIPPAGPSRDAATSPGAQGRRVPDDPITHGPVTCGPLGLVCGGRSGDKGGNANVGLWAKTDAAYAWLAEWLTVDRFRELLPEAAGLDIRRYDLPNLRALNFVVAGILGEGVASSTRVDAQAKGLAEFIRSRPVPLPTALLEANRPEASR